MVIFAPSIILGVWFRHADETLARGNKGFFNKIVKFIVRGVAQLASALAWGARGRMFESSHPD